MNRTCEYCGTSVPAVGAMYDECPNCGALVRFRLAWNPTPEEWPEGEVWAEFGREAGLTVISPDRTDRE